MARMRKRFVFIAASCLTVPIWHGQDDEGASSRRSGKAERGKVWLAERKYSSAFQHVPAAEPEHIHARKKGHGSRLAEVECFDTLQGKYGMLT